MVQEAAIATSSCYDGVIAFEESGEAPQCTLECTDARRICSLTWISALLLPCVLGPGAVLRR